MIEIINGPKKVKARKSHLCDFCGRRIEKNEIHNTEVMKDDYIYSWKSHLKCLDIAHELRMYDETTDDGLTSDDFWTYITEEYISLKGPKNAAYGDQLDYVLKAHLKPKIAKTKHGNFISKG